MESFGEGSWRWRPSRMQVQFDAGFAESLTTLVLRRSRPYAIQVWLSTGDSLQRAGRRERAGVPPAGRLFGGWGL